MAQRSSGLTLRTLSTLACALLFTPALLAGCSGNCVDDGFVWNQGKDCGQTGVSATDSNSDSSSDSLSATVTQGSMSLPTEGSASATESATDGGGSMSASESATEAVSATDTEGNGGCSNGVKDGDETDVDCGGSCGSSCELGEICIDGNDCITLTCDGMACVPDPGCSDGMKGPGETDVDCGGQCGPTCETGEGCIQSLDCVSDFCELSSSTCQEPSCDDGEQNGDETDIDCGGSCGSTCGTDELCLTDDDCASMLCQGDDTCSEDPLCTNGMQDNGETDVDCGGPCGPTCEVDESCNNDTDCVGNYCDADMTCDQPTCDDGEQNGDETDVDCGGACGPTCEGGEHCLGNPDCVDDYCNPLEVCAAQQCVITADDNQCQACIKGSCCDNVTECLLDPKCACWLECIEQNNDFAPCTESCDIKGKPGPITSCANSKCNTLDACDVQ